MGGDPPDWAYPRRILPQGGPPFGRDANATISGGAVGVPSVGSVDGSSGPGGGGDISPLSQ